MNVLLIGSGGREHALAWALSASPLLTKLYCAPGNAGIEACAECVALDAADHDAIIDFCRHACDRAGGHRAGSAARRRAGGRSARGGHQDVRPRQGRRPSSKAPKGFTKALCAETGIPTAAFGHFSDRHAALAYLRGRPVPIVIKADGLAAGKGVVVAETLQQAEDGGE